MQSYLPTLKNTSKFKKLKIKLEKLNKVVSEGDAAKVKTFLEECAVSDDAIDDIRHVEVLVNCEDENGLSPLQISARLGFTEICDLLINYGADIDISSENWPSPLMLAASNNHYDVVKFLLEHNANIRSSCPNHTAAYEAAVKGYTEIKKLINNHVIKRAIDLYFETAKIEDSEYLRKTLNELLKNDNKHPVRLFLNLRENVEMRLQNNLLKIINALAGLCELQYLTGNEKLSLICHSIKFLFMVAYNMLYSTEQLEFAMFSDRQILDDFITSCLKNQPKNGYSQDLLNCMQSVIDDYPYKDTEIYRIVKEVPFNQFNNEHSSLSTCETCRNWDNIKFCVCRKVKYCSRDCQLLHRSFHKTECGAYPGV